MKFLLISLLFLNTLFANENIDFENDFLDSLNEVSEIATKTKLNIDDTPSFVTVLHSNKLKKLGVENILQALSLVPGVQVKREASGVYVVVFRGATQKGEVKLMVDGVSINNAFRGSIYYYLDFPIELIDRIEVIRGSGSVLYGSGAISGVVNIVTKSTQNTSNEVFISGGAYNTYKGGALISTKIKDIKLKLDGYYTKNDKTISTGPDVQGTSGDSDQRVKDYSVGLNLSGDNLSFMTRIKKAEKGNAYGLYSVIDLSKVDYYNINRVILTELKYQDNISLNNKIIAKAGYTNYKQDIKERHSSNQDTNGYNEENSNFVQADFISKSIKDNELVLGASFYNYDLKKTDVKLGSSIINLVNEDSNRDIYSLYIADNYKINEILTMSAGVRYDDYSDFGDALVPHAGAVIKLNEKVRLKAQYSNAYRAPSWIELTSNQNLNAEKSHTYELGLVYKQNIYNTFKVTAYKMNINDVIKKVSGVYKQESKNNFLGTEVEYLFTPNEKAEFSLNASYINAKDENNDDIEDVANVLASTSLTYEFDSGIIIGSLFKYLSKSKRATNDTRDDFDDTLLYDQTISYILNNFTFSAVVKDLFNHGTNYPSPVNTYVNDFEDEGRTFLLKASMEF